MAQLYAVVLHQSTMIHQNAILSVVSVVLWHTYKGPLHCNLGVNKYYVSVWYMQIPIAGENTVVYNLKSQLANLVMHFSTLLHQH